MQYEVEFEMNDGDDEPETGIMIDIINSSYAFGSATKAVIVLGSGSVIVRDLDLIRIVDKEIGQKFLKIEKKHQDLDLPVDIVNG